MESPEIRSAEFNIVLAILADMDYNDGAMMRWSSGRPTAQAARVANRIIRELHKEEAAK